MTAQLTDSILFEGQSYGLHCTPLSDYFALSGVDPDLRPMGTCCWRGYVARWELVGGRLYLLEVRGELPVGKLTLGHLFPAFPERVFAHWFNGELRLPHGERLASVNRWFGGLYEREWVLEVERGVLVKRRLQENSCDPDTWPPGMSDRPQSLGERMKAWWSYNL